MDDPHAHERLDALEARIRRLERELADRRAGGPGPKFYETGSIHPELEDRAIAP